jgi:hypothetical protein
MECESEFNDKDAICENWRNPEKKLGCPSCKTFYRCLPENISIDRSILTMILIMSMIGFMNSFSNSDLGSKLYLGTILILSIVLHFRYLNNEAKYKKIERAKKS